ncbi:MAG: transposase [Aeromonas sp.]
MDSTEDDFEYNADALSDVPSDVEDFAEESIDNINEEILDEPFQPMRRQPRTFQLSCSDSDENNADNEDDGENNEDAEDNDEDSDDEDIDWSTIDTLRDNESFQDPTGPRIAVEKKSIEAVVDCFIGSDILEYIVAETNKYYVQNTQKYKVAKKTKKWIDVTVSEIRKFFALIIIMGLVRKVKINDYWSTNPLIETPIFSKTMTRNRFRQILQHLHFNDNSNIPQDADRLFKIQFLIDYFSKKFKENFSLGQNISLDEGMVPWRGRLNFKVYNPSKIVKYGILVRMVCDAVTGYISTFKLYSGTGGKLNDTVMELLENSCGKWHHLYMDNLYNSVELTKKLFLKKFRVCGTIRINRGLPKELKSAKLKVMETTFLRRGEILLQIFKSNKKKDVRMISSIHNADLIDTGKKDRKTGNTIFKPKCIMDYNQFMKGVDRADQFLSYYPIYDRKTIKWTKKVALYLINCALFNSFRVYEHLNKNEIKKIKFNDFLLEVANKWITSEDVEVPAPSTSNSRGRLSGGFAKHQVEKISTVKYVRRRCHVCYKNKITKYTTFWCKNCKVALHLGKCFSQYHVSKKL